MGGVGLVFCLMVGVFRVAFESIFVLYLVCVWSTLCACVGGAI